MSAVTETEIEYRDLPADFWDKIIYYEYFITFSGFADDEPRVAMWSSSGEQYYINSGDFQGGHFEKAIPFFESLVDEECRAGDSFFYFDWKKLSDDWKYYYKRSNHCFLPTCVYEEFSKYQQKIEDADRKIANGLQGGVEGITEYIACAILWKEILKRVYKMVLGVTIQEDHKTHIICSGTTV